MSVTEVVIFKAEILIILLWFHYINHTTSLYSPSLWCRNWVLTRFSTYVNYFIALINKRGKFLPTLIEAPRYTTSVFSKSPFWQISLFAMVIEGSSDYSQTFASSVVVSTKSSPTSRCSLTLTEVVSACLWIELGLPLLYFFRLLFCAFQRLQALINFI